MRAEDVGFNGLLNQVYAAMVRSVEGPGRSCSRLVVDLTHGTNALVSAVLLAAAMISTACGVEVEAYMAPVMGRPGGSVEFLDVSDSISAVNNVAAGIMAWWMLDERLLPTRNVERMGRQLGKKYGPLFGETKKC